MKTKINSTSILPSELSELNQDTELVTQLSSDLSDKNYVDYEVLPQRLVMIRIIDNCNWCINPKGEVFCTYISISHHFGFLSCIKCIHKAVKTKKEWLSQNAFGPLKHLQDVDLNIQRSNGAIENGWKLNIDIPMTNTDNDDNITVNCINDGLQLERWCRVDRIIELNPIN